MINWFAITILGIWLFAALGSILAKDSDPFFFAFLITFLMGFGYLISITMP